MRNIFDQYSQPENRLTHALVVSLSEDSKLLKSFVRWITDRSLSQRLFIVEQRLPGEPEVTEEESEKRGLPDAWIYDDSDWGLLIESKVSATLTNDQLKRHYQTALRRGYENIQILAINTLNPTKALMDGVIVRTWSEIYEWLYKQDYSDWAKKTLKYFEIAEAKWSSDGYLKEGTLTKFSGIPFSNDNPYNYPEAKRLIRLMMDDLRKHKGLQRELHMDPAAPGRGMITGKATTSVWDFLRIKEFKHEKDFIRMVHLTMGITADKLRVMVTLPNGIKSQYRNNLIDQGYDEFEDVMRQVHHNLHKKLGQVKGVESFVEVIQRHYIVQSAPSTTDAVAMFSLDTAFSTKGSKVKHQPLWLQSAHELMHHKKGNTQLGIGVFFPYSKCPAVQQAEIIDHVADAWIACKPFIQKIISG